MSLRIFAVDHKSFCHSVTCFDHQITVASFADNRTGNASISKLRIGTTPSGRNLMMGGDGDERSGVNRTTRKVVSSLSAFAQWPGDKLREWTAPFRERNKSVYYHKRYPEVTSIEDCVEADQLCWFEANEKYLRDKKVDEQILAILRQRVTECCLYYGQDQKFRCKKEKTDYDQAETNYFSKYGDMGVFADRDVMHAFRRQQHRMVWERRNKRSLIDGSPIEE